ncbi:DUF6180 family protein [Luteimonas sp. RC10]|uniref:DUF6180 family protein n=1 Tax=Luteimonas sp. RC10 TaxID=2587035 RepID=UPI001612CF89|nr:DUF6180 family protein [Luteimonas sp. RC10]MBB3342217.1 hypothetical protein [Luteimonas sp. RC10]
MKQVSLATLLALAVSAPMASATADDFSLGYDVDRYPATQLNIKACLAALARGAAAVGYTTRAQSDQGTLATHVSGPAGGGRALVSYCISAGDHTAFVVQALDYSGPDSRGPDTIKARVAAEVRKAAGAR